MSLLYSSLCRATLGFALIFCMPAPLLFNSVHAAQELSREEASKEAGKLGTEAERLRGEAYKKVQAGGDRGLITEAEREAARKFRQAIELWRKSGDDQRLVAGVEELTRIYSVIGDYEATIGCLRREADYWAGRGDLQRQVRMLWFMGIRQMQMRREKEAIETFERVVEMSRGAGLVSVERNTLDFLARLYDKHGRGEEAEQLRVRIKGQSWIDTTPADVRAPSKPPVIPDQWMDLPSAPLSAEYRDVDGERKAVLVNRSAKAISSVSFGCVEEHEGKVRVVSNLGGEARTHGGVGPGSYFNSFAWLNGPMNQWTDKKMGCEGAAKLSLTMATYRDKTSWVAEGADWPNK